MISSPKRILQLDGLRGLAALMIAISHSYSVYAIGPIHDIWVRTLFTVTGLPAIFTRLILLINNADVAIAIFFILSGLVLGNSLSKSEINRRTILVFYVKRIIRLYPVYLFVIAATVIFLTFGFHYQSHAFSSDWFNSLFNNIHTFKELLLNIILKSTTLSIVAWTLAVEFQVIIIFPFLDLISRQNQRFINILMVFILVSMGILFPKPAFIQYIYYFYLGLIMPQWESIFKKIFQNQIVSTFVFGFSSIVVLASHDFILAPYRQYIVVLLTWLIIGLLDYCPMTFNLKFFTHSFLTKLGQISYPFYLCHFLILYILTYSLNLYLPIMQLRLNSVILHFGLAFISIFITYKISLVLHHLIEIPLARFSHLIN
jgi:peptidoglycan/LPS O-acetylase OafA/YrhL